MKVIKVGSISYAVLLSMLGLSGAANAQECLLTPVSVPGLSGLPFWYDSAGVTKRLELDDPRWGGAPLRSFANDPGGTSASFRALRQGNILAVSLQALSDSNGASDFDAVYFGISTSTSGSTAHMFRLQPATSGSPDPVASDFAATGTYWSRTASAWDAGSTTPPAWFVDTDPVAPGVQYSTWRNMPAGAVWAINLKVDLAMAGVVSTNDFKLFYAVETHTSGSNCVVNPGGCTIVSYTTPVVPGGTTLLGGTPAPENPSSWELTDDLSTACTGGATISSFNIAVDNADGTDHTTIDTNGTMVSPATPASPALNTFHADVFDIPGVVSSNLIRGKFSLAHWGSTIADPNAPWDVVVITPGATPTLANAINNSLVPAPGGPANSTRIQFTCSTGATGNVYCPTLPAGADGHQCMLVELSAVPPQSVKFSRAAAYRNMNFENLSTLDRKARITIQGLQKATGVAKDRDVYLYIKTSNMPAPGSEPIWLPAKAMADARRYAATPPPRPPFERQDKPGIAVKPQRPALVSAAAPRQEQQVLSAVAPRPSEVPVLSGYQKLVEVWPTYEVHVYYDSGELIERREAKLKRLVEMVPFGYLLAHDGPLYGFTHLVEGLNGVVLEEVAPSFYRVHVKNEGSFEVRTKIASVDEAPPPEGCPTCPEPCAPPQCPPPVDHGRCNCRVVGAPGSTYGGYALLAGVLGIGLWTRRLRRCRRRARRG